MYTEQVRGQRVEKNFLGGKYVDKAKSLHTYIPPPPLNPPLPFQQHQRLFFKIFSQAHSGKNSAFMKFSGQ